MKISFERETGSDTIKALGFIGTTICGGAAGWTSHKEEYVPELKNTGVKNNCQE